MKRIYSTCLYLSLLVAVSISFATKATDNLENLEKAVHAKRLNCEDVSALDSLTLAPFRPQTPESRHILPGLHLLFEHRLAPTRLTTPITQPRPQDKTNRKQNGFLDLKPEVQRTIIKEFLEHNFNRNQIKSEVDIKSKSHIDNMIKGDVELTYLLEKQQEAKGKIDTEIQKVAAQCIALKIETYLKDEANIKHRKKSGRKRKKEPAVALTKEGGELESDEENEFESAWKKFKLPLPQKKHTKFSNEDDEGSHDSAPSETGEDSAEVMKSTSSSTPSPSSSSTTTTTRQ